jgi:integrase
MIDQAHFERWLRRKYQPSTVQDTLLDVQRLEEAAKNDEEVPDRLAWSARRLLAYAEDHLDRWPRGLKGFVEEVASSPPKTTDRKHDARSFGDEDWAELVSAVEEDESVEARVLEIMSVYGLRIGDVLRTGKKDVQYAVGRTGVLKVVQKGGRQRLLYLDDDGDEEPWARLWREHWTRNPAETVAWLVCPDGDGSPRAGKCAYQRVRRKLTKLAKKLDLEGRANTHRLRRTVGVQALRVTEDVPAVQQLLGHKSYSTTMGYLDEARPEKEADVRKQLKKFRRKK